MDQIVPWFRADLGRPSKELYTILGVLVLQQMQDLTDDETVNQLAFHEQWHYALNITEERDAAKYMCPKTLWNIRKKVTDQELDTVLFDQVTEKLARVFQVDPSKQRLDSVHIKSNMRRLGRLGLLVKCMHRFLVNLKRQHAELYAFLSPELVDRYLGKKALGCFSQVKPSESTQKLASVCQEIFLLVERFGEHPEVAKMLSYRMLQRVLDEHCEVKPAADSGPEEITVKPAREISSKSLQNPSDPEAGYSGHKGQGYQVQVMETYCDSEVPQVKAQTLNLITHAAAAPAYESDTQALLPALKDTQARELGPEEVLADTPYGSDDNCQQAAALNVEVVAPVTGPPFHRRAATPVPNAPAARSNPGTIITIGATVRRTVVWPNAGPEGGPWRPARGPNRAGLSLFFLSKSTCKPSGPRLPTLSSPMYLATHLS